MPGGDQARVLLGAADGVSNTAIQAKHGVSRPTINAWRARFLQRGLERFGQVEPRRGPKPSIPQVTAERVARLARRAGKTAKAAYYSNRTAAQTTGVSHAAECG